MSDFKWEEAGTVDHGKLKNLYSEYFPESLDDHLQYLNDSRHNVIQRHQLGGAVPRDKHALLEGLDADDHQQYINAERHNRTRHPPTIATQFEMVTCNFEPVFADGDIIITEVQNG